MHHSSLLLVNVKVHVVGHSDYRQRNANNSDMLLRVSWSAGDIKSLFSIYVTLHIHLSFLMFII